MSNSAMSNVAHTSSKVNGLFAVTARNPSPHMPRVAAQVYEFVNIGRATAVSRMASVSADRLIEYAQERPSAWNAIGLTNKAIGRQTSKIRVIGTWDNQTTTLTSARKAPPIATS